MNTRRRQRLILVALWFLSVATVEAQSVVRYVTGGLSPGPAAGDGRRLYVASEDRYLYAFAFDGTRLWRSDLRRKPLGPPVVGPDNTVHVPVEGLGVAAYNRTGSLLWRLSVPDIRPPLTISRRGLLIVPRGGGRISVFSPVGAPLLTFDTSAETTLGPLLPGSGKIIVAAGRRLAAYDGAGAEAWKRTLSSRISALAAADQGGVFAGLADGSVVQVTAGGDIESRWTLSSGVRELGSRSGASLVALLQSGVIWCLDRSEQRAWEARPPGTRFDGVVAATEWVAAVSENGAAYVFGYGGELRLESRLPEVVSLSYPSIVANTGLSAVGSNWTVYLFDVPVGRCAVPWGCQRGGVGLSGRPEGLEAATDFRLTDGNSDGSLDRIYLTRLLTSDRPDEREEALAVIEERLDEGRLGASTVYAVPLLASLARGDDNRIAVEQRIEATGLLSRIGTYEAAAALRIAAATSSDEAVARGAAEALGRLGSDPHGRSARSLEALLTRHDTQAAAEAVVSAAERLVAYAGTLYHSAIVDIITRISEGSYPTDLKRRAGALGSLETVDW